MRQATGLFVLSPIRQWPLKATCPVDLPWIIASILNGVTLFTTLVKQDFSIRNILVKYGHIKSNMFNKKG